MEEILGFISTIIIGIVIFKFYKIKQEKLRRYNNGEMSKVEEEQFKIQLDNKEKRKKKRTYRKELKQNQQLIKRQRYKDSKIIIKTKIVGADEKIITDNNDSLIRGLVGGFLFGLTGTISGATSGDKKLINNTIFLIEYADGHRITKTVKNNSYEFKRLCKYLEM